jgi:hypothetical protein
VGRTTLRPRGSLLQRTAPPRVHHQLHCQQARRCCRTRLGSGDAAQGRRARPARQEAQLESQRRVLDFLETELAVERTLTQGRAAREANIATALQASVGSLAATACDLMRARPARRPRTG